jgi:alkanesulfonate monooxygenase SsuD/methylene tetrahydromethanopterin reductase-like flavin-dependent oxidoreductase (luciferase family)
MREYLDGLLPLLAGQAADAVGEIWTTKRIADDTRRTEPRRVHRRDGQMPRLAGRRTAGTLTWMTGPKTLAEHVVPTLREVAAEAGRSEADVHVAAALPVTATDDVDGARQHAAEQFTMYGTLPSYRAMLDREGYAAPEDAAIIGDEATVTDRLAELRAAGVAEFAAATFDASRENRARTRALLRQLDE